MRTVVQRGVCYPRILQGTGKRCCSLEDAWSARCAARRCVSEPACACRYTGYEGIAAFDNAVATVYWHLNHSRCAFATLVLHTNPQLLWRAGEVGLQNAAVAGGVGGGSGDKAPPPPPPKLDGRSISRDHSSVTFELENGGGQHFSCFFS